MFRNTCRLFLINNHFKTDMFENTRRLLLINIHANSHQVNWFHVPRCGKETHQSNLPVNSRSPCSRRNDAVVTTAACVGYSGKNAPKSVPYGEKNNQTNNGRVAQYETGRDCFRESYVFPRLKTP